VPVSLFDNHFQSFSQVLLILSLAGLKISVKEVYNNFNGLNPCFYIAPAAMAFRSF
jgi:hypothetical protein